MAINIKFDLAGNPEPPTILLANRNGNILGQLDIDVESVDISDKFNDASEFSFTIYKYIDDKLTNLWDKVVDFKLVYCKEWDTWFEIKVELDESTETIKTVFCTQLEKAELSQLNLYNIEINTEEDMKREDYDENYPTLFYRDDHTEASLLHRLLKDKAPHYSIVHVDKTLKDIKKILVFTFDGTSIDDAFQEIAEEIGCVFIYHSYIDEDRILRRTISVYDLQQNCNSCGHRGEFTDKCPKCGSTDINYNEDVFKDTGIFIDKNELASEGIELVTDTDAVKNCFKLEAGDDLMTATIRNCNPNGTDYLWYLSDAVKEDMSKELVDKLNSYDDLYKNYYNNYESKLNTSLVDKYNSLVKKYEGFYNTKSTCINCDYEGFFENTCPNCNSTSILSGKILQSIPTTIKGYSSLMNAYYNTIDLGLYLKSGLMPTVEMSGTTAKEQASLLTVSNLSPVAVNNDNIQSLSLETANSAVLSMAKIIVKPTYKVEVKTSVLSADKVWEGNFVVTNYSDENDTSESQTIRVVVNNDTETFVKQKIDKALNKDNTDDYSISGLFEKEYDDFCAELKKYSLNPLKSFYDSCDTCINILIDNGAGDKTKNPDLYEKLYVPYYQKSSAISAEMKTREDEITIIEGIWNNTDEKNPKLITKGLRQYIEECRNKIQDALNFEKYLGEELWLEFCAYRREDTYSNDNYISDGLNNAQLFEMALKFIEAAENEIYKSAELQHSISTSLNNLLAIDKFKPLVDSFEVGNWIRVQVDDRIFKLRLLEYEIDFGSFENISVEFSDVTKIKNGITDVKDVIDQASSMATSYSSIQRQADQGNRARNTIDQWITDGLNSALIQIQNNDNEEVTMTKNGLLCRSYNDITGDYLPEQFKLTHNIMAYTTDNWETVSSALGKHSYKKWNNNTFTDDVGYGLSSTFVTAGYITGSQIIGGEIISSNYASGTSGTYFDLINGDFEIAGGKILYDTQDDKLILSGVTIQWDSMSDSDKPQIENIDGLSDYIKQLEDLEDQVGNLDSQIGDRAETWYQDTDPSIEWTNNDTKALHIGDLWHYTGDTKTVNGVKRIRNSEWIWRQVGEVYQWVAIEISDEIFDAIDGKSQIFISTPTPPYDIGDLWVQGSTGDILHCTTSRGENESYNAGDWIRSSKYTDDAKALEALEKAEQGIEDAAKAINLANSINIGGRNLLLNTVETKLLTNKAESYTISDYGKNILSDGEEVTISFDVKSDVNTNIETYPKYLHTDGSYYYNGAYAKTFSVTTDWRRYSFSFNLPSGNWHLWTVRSNTYVTGGSATANVQVRNVKLESGNKNTDWTSAPEDVKNAYEAYTESKVGKLDASVADYLGLGGSTLIGDKYMVSPYIGGGYLNITSGKKRVIIDPNNLSGTGYIFAALNDGKVTLGMDADGNADFTGKITATEGYIGGVDGWVIGDKKMYSGKESLDSSFKGIYLGTDGIHVSEGNNSFKVCIDDTMSLNIANEATYYFKDGYIYDADDMRAAHRMCVGLEHDIDKYKSLSDQEMLSILDVNGNGKIDAADALLISRKQVNLAIDTRKMAFSISKDGIVLSNVDGTIFSATRDGVTATELTTAVSSVTDETSDIKVKHTVENLPDNYDVLFDNLTPRRFKYNHGTSNRFHTGFIAQEIVEALEKSNLTTQDFATVVHLDVPLSNGAEWALRKEEMVALNTWQIQKLKARVAELEEKIDSLINS